MIIILKNNPDPDQLSNLTYWLNGMGVQVHPTVGSSQTILGLVGDTSRIDMDLIKALDIVENVKRVQEPFKNANRKFHPDDTVIKVGNAMIGGGQMAIIAGPCMVESEEQIMRTAAAVKKSGAQILRAGTFKPRSSPYAFQGMRIEGLRLLLRAKEETGLPVMTEILDPSQLSLFADVDILQVGSRNMQNYTLLNALGQIDKPVLLKRGYSATYEEWLMSAEHIMAGGNRKVILCERGIRTFETYTKNTLDISCVPVLKSITHLPVIVDPCNAAGSYRFVPSLASASIAAGADGVLLEVHNDPEHALCDGPQSLNTENFDRLAEKLRSLHEVVR